MSQKLNHTRNFANSCFKKISLSLGLALCVGVSYAEAVPTLNPANQLLSQAPEDVIINPNGSSSNRSTTVNSNQRFTCESNNGQYTVMYRPESQPNQAYPWAVPGTMGNGWSPERRCAEISSRLEKYRPDGLIDLTVARENGENILCVTTEAVPGCRIVLTVPRGQDPTQTRDAVFQNLTVADSGQQTQGVNTYAGGGNDAQMLNQLQGVLGIGKKSNSSEGINLKPFLDPKDGGTGDRLQPQNKSNSRLLKPSLFR
jgi:hypothetical protein